jgi:hypothetical protein
MRRLIPLAVALAACVKAPPPDQLPANQPHSVMLVQDTAERETTQWPSVREDVTIDTTQYDRTPHVVAFGETPVLQSEGAEVRLYGDKDGTQGWSVDNLLLLELFDASGSLRDRTAIGFTDGLLVGKEHVDLLGRQSFRFEAGEVDLSRFVPEHGAWKIRATVLDYYGVGHCSDVWLRIEDRKSGPAFEKID